jgi:ubiquinone/menaquinone biosynthesis C-methylase UbiE
MDIAKQSVRDFWEEETCGIRYADGVDEASKWDAISSSRYDLIPEIEAFARFQEGRGKAVLEVGVGAGSDFERWVTAGAIATGIDLTQAAIENTRDRLSRLHGLDNWTLKVADAEALPFEDSSFDIYYSWGVVHHSPDTPSALTEAARVLKPGGALRIMVYHRRSWMALFYWIRFAAMRGRPFMSLATAISSYMESPGTKAYTLREAEALLASAGFIDINVTPRLCQGDYLDLKLRAGHDSAINRLAVALAPRGLIKFLGHRFGGMLMISARRPA